MSIQDYKKILSQYSQMIRENVNLPLYYQVELIINNFIENEDIKHGVSFFSEIEVAEELNVSRPTVNKAFKNLVEKGLLTKKRGKRNVVNKVDNIRLVFISELVSFGQMIQTQGVKCKTVLLDRMKIKATPKVQGALKLQPGDEVVYLKRLRFVKNDPIIIVESYLPFPKYGKLLNIPAESYSEDLSKINKKLFSISVVKSDREVTATSISIQDAQLLNEEIWDSCLRLVGVNYINDHEPCEYFDSKLKGDKCILKTTLSVNMSK